MTDLGKQPNRHKSRKVSTPVYPLHPPTLPSTIEMLFISESQEALATAVKEFNDRIVTSQVLYKPGILGIARIVFHANRWDLRLEREVARIILFPQQSLPSDWDQNLTKSWQTRHTPSTADEAYFFVYDHTYDFSQSRIESLQEEFIQYLTSKETLRIEYNPFLKLPRKMDESEDSFAFRCIETGRKSFENEIRNLEETMQRLKDRLKEKLDREVREIGSDRLEMQKTDSRARKHQETMDVQQEIDIHESIAAIDEINRQFEEVAHLKEEKAREIEESLQNIAKEREVDLIRISRTNVQLLRFALVWLPYTEYVVQEEDSRKVILLQSF